MICFISDSYNVYSSQYWKKIQSATVKKWQKYSFDEEPTSI